MGRIKFSDNCNYTYNISDPPETYTVYRPLSLAQIKRARTMKSAMLLINIIKYEIVKLFLYKYAEERLKYLYIPNIHYY